MKSTKVFVIGIGFTVCTFVAVLNIQAAALLVSGCALLTVLAGFFFRVPRDLVQIPLSPVADGENGPVVSGKGIGERFPQLLTYAIQAEGFELLGLMTIVPLAVAFWAAKDMVAGRSGFNPNNKHYVIFYVLMFATLILLVFAVGRIRERILLRKGVVTLAHVHVFANSRKFQYEFRDANGVHAGGAGIRPTNKQLDSLVPVFYMPDNPDNNKVAPLFAFYRFMLLERRNVPVDSGTLQPRI